VRLGREAFAEALRKGLGRAMVHVRKHGDAGVDDLIREACVHCHSYDWQSEGHRGAWMMAMISALPDREGYLQTVIAAFPEAREDRDIDQMAYIVTELADEGRPGMRELLYDKLERREFSSDWIVCPNILHLDGMEGLSRIARVLSTFRRIDAPGGASRLLLLVDSEDAELRAAVVEALARFEDERIAVLSTKWLAAGSLDGLPLVERNHRPGDFSRIAELLPKGGEDERLHGLGSDIISANRGRLQPEAVHCLLWI
jgi:hypothetical protein